MDEKVKVDIVTVPKPKGKKGRKAGAIYFPRMSLKEALRVPTAIWKYNSGNPFALGDVCGKLGYSVMSSGFRELLRASERYGLTEGTWQQNATHRISLSNRGLSIVAPKVGENVNLAIMEALTNSGVIKKFLESINGRIIPPYDVLKSTLIRDHHLSNEEADACYKVIIKNIEDYGLYTHSADSKVLRLDKLTSSGSIPLQRTEEMEEPHDELPEQEIIADIPKEIPKPRIFISHSKNDKILQQIKQILALGDFEYKIAEEIETTSIPIPEKIFGLMRECNSALINISADKQQKREDETFGINQNVLIEIGAAFLRYDKRVVLLVDKRISLPSNLQGLYISYYDGDELSWDTGVKLQNTLKNFRTNLPASSDDTV